MNLLAAIRNVHIRDIPEPESMTDYWRNRPVAESDCNCKKCTDGSNPYGDESCDSYQKPSLAELMELAWKEWEETCWGQTQDVWQQYEETKRPLAVMVEQNPEVMVKTRTIRIRPAEWEINDTRKEVRANRRRNTKRRQRRRLDLLKTLAFGAEMLEVDVVLEFSSTESAERTLYIPAHLVDFLAGTIANKLEKDYHFTGSFTIVRLTPHKLKGKPWQAAHMPAKNLDYDYDYIAEQRQRSAELRHQTVCAAHDRA